jgi:C-terminal processing protease CtpA/Prc
MSLISIKTPNRLLSYVLNYQNIPSHGKQPITAFRPQIRNKNRPIVVFTSKRTASSGEGILIALKNNPNVRIFGEPTAGLTTANGNYPLKDGAELIITSAIFTDKNGKLYGDKIMPDVNLSDKWYYISGFEHAIMLSEARKWFDSFRPNK